MNENGSGWKPVVWTGVSILVQCYFFFFFLAFFFAATKITSDPLWVLNSFETD